MLALEVWVLEGLLLTSRRRMWFFAKLADEAWHGQEWSKKRLGERELHKGSMAGLHEQQRCSSRFHLPDSPSKCFH